MRLSKPVLESQLPGAVCVGRDDNDDVDDDGDGDTHADADAECDTGATHIVRSSSTHSPV